MGIGISVLLLAVGAILAFAIDVSVQGIDLSVAGLILMAAGVIGMTLVLLVWGPGVGQVTEGRVAETDRG